MTFTNAFINDPCVTVSLSVERKQWQCVTFSRGVSLDLCNFFSVAQSNRRQKNVIHGELGVL